MVLVAPKVRMAAMLAWWTPSCADVRVRHGGGTDARPDGMSDPAVLVERDGHVLTVTLNRPDKRNAFNAEVLCRLCDAWDLLDTDPRAAGRRS